MRTKDRKVSPEGTKSAELLTYLYIGKRDFIYVNVVFVSHLWERISVLFYLVSLFNSFYV